MVAGQPIRQGGRNRRPPSLAKKSEILVGEQVKSPKQLSLRSVGWGTFQQRLTCRSVRARG